jgi:hypothetical protein
MIENRKNIKYQPSGIFSVMLSVMKESPRLIHVLEITEQINTADESSVPFCR